MLVPKFEKHPLFSDYERKKNPPFFLPKSLILNVQQNTLSSKNACVFRYMRQSTLFVRQKIHEFKLPIENTPLYRENGHAHGCTPPWKSNRNVFFQKQISSRLLDINRLCLVCIKRSIEQVKQCQISKRSYQQGPSDETLKNAQCQFCRVKFGHRIIIITDYGGGEFLWRQNAQFYPNYF